MKMERKKPSGRIPAELMAEHEAALISVSRELFSTFGYRGASIEKIARTAHVSPKTIYARFGGKAGLFRVAMQSKVENIVAPLAVPATSVTELRAALIEFAIRLLSVTISAEGMRVQRVLISEYQRFPMLAADFLNEGQVRGTKLLTAIFGRANEAGLVKVADAHASAEMFIGALLGAPFTAALFGNKRLSKKAIALRAGQVVALFVGR